MLHFIIGLFISFIYSFLILPNKEGSEPKINPTIYPILYKGMIIIPYNKAKAIHLHHWMWSFLICVISMFICIPPFITGFSVGLFLQGIGYQDRWDFICINPYY